jgi:hypothetical protein
VELPTRQPIFGYDWQYLEAPLMPDHDDPIEAFDRAYPIGRNTEPPEEAERPIPERFALPELPPRDQARFELPDVPAPEPAEAKPARLQPSR